MLLFNKDAKLKRHGVRMTIYVEYVIFNNFFIDYLVLYISALILKRHIAWWRFIFGAFIGAGYAVIAPLLPYPYDIPLKLIALLIMCVAVSGFQPKAFAKYILVFTALTFALGGAVMGLANLSGDINKLINTPDKLSFGVVAIITIISVIAIKFALRWLNIKKVSGELLTVKLSASETCECKGFYDSGNRLYYKGLYPVIIADEKLPLGKAVGKINITTIVGKSVSDVYAIKTVTVNGKIFKDVYAVKKSINQEYGIILHCDLI